MISTDKFFLCNIFVGIKLQEMSYIVSFSTNTKQQLSPFLFTYLSVCDLFLSQCITITLN